MAKTVKFKAVGGIRNDVSAERYSPEDLVTGLNADIDETGRASSRRGMVRVSTGVIHSLFAGTQRAFCVKDNVLSELYNDHTFRSVANVGDVDSVVYKEVNGAIYWTSGKASGIIDATGDRAWGVPTPQPVSAFSALGNLPSGSYLLSMTYLRADGWESGASHYTQVEVPEYSGVEVVLPASTDPTVVAKRVYMTQPNGELLYAVAEVPNLTASVVVADIPEATLTLRTSNMRAAPHGSVLGVYKGRLYVAVGTFLWYSQPHEFELFGNDNYVVFDKPVRTFAPVSDGIFVGTTESTVFLQGDDPAEFTQMQVAPYGTIKGTEVAAPNNVLMGEQGVQGEAAMWASTQGICVGVKSGVMQNLTGSRYVMPGVSQGAGFVKRRDGTTQYVVTLFN